MAAGYPMVRLVESDFPDSPSPTIVHHQYEPSMLTVNLKLLTKNPTTYTKPYESEVR